MLINVSTLLQEPVGSARRYRVEDETVSVPSEGYEREIDGTVRLIRSERGVLVMAELDLSPVPLECARCLEGFETPLSLAFDEEYVLDRDPLTGRPLPVEAEDFRIDEHRHLDLSEAVRQYEQAALPLRPLCRADCQGLCPHCGRNRNTDPCTCADSPDDRWSALAGLQQRLEMEDGDGAPKT